jgi:hypothetical protein
MKQLITAFIFFVLPLAASSNRTSQTHVQEPSSPLDAYWANIAVNSGHSYYGRL